MKLLTETRATISVFLAIILTVTIVLSGALVDGARIRAGESEVQTAVDSAANSTLADYNNMMKELYGLFALTNNDPDSLDEEIGKYLDKTLMTELGLDKKSMGDNTYDYLKQIFTGGSKLGDVNFMNLFDYRVEDVKATPVYNLTENPVLRKQIVEYMKYRAPKVFLEGFLDKLDSLKGFSKQSKVIKKKADVDKKLDDIKDLQERACEGIENVNAFISKNVDQSLKEDISSYVESITTRIQAEKENVALENQISEVNTKISSKEKEISEKEKAIKEAEAKKEETTALDTELQTLTGEKVSLQSESANLNQRADLLIDTIHKQREKTLNLYNSINETMEKYIGYNGNTAEVLQSIMDTSGKTVNMIDDINNNDLKGDKSDFGVSIKDENAVKRKQLDFNSLAPIKDDLLENKRIMTEMKTRFAQVNGNSITSGMVPFDYTDNSNIKANIASRVDENALEVFLGEYKEVHNPFTISLVKMSSIDPRKDADSIASGSSNPLNDKSLKERSGKSDFYKGELPSGGGKVKSPNFDKEDEAYLKTAIGNGDYNENPDNQNADPEKMISAISFSDNTTDKTGEGFDAVSGMLDQVEKGFEGMRNELYVDEYAIGTFKNAVTPKFENSTGKEPERDLRDNLKSSRNTYFNNEIEYILTGTSNDGANVLAVEAQILLVRFVLNTIYIYTDSEKRNEALAAATAIAGWTGFGVPIVQTVIMLAWSMSESIIDVNYLMRGDSVPVFKTRDTWVLGREGAVKKLKSEASELMGDAAKKVVNYGFDKADDVVNRAYEKTKTMIDNKIDSAVDKLFQPFEDALNSAQKKIDQVSVEDINLAEVFRKDSTPVMNEIENKLESLIIQEFNSKKRKLEEDIIGNTADLARTHLEEAKTYLKTSVKAALTDGGENSLLKRLYKEISDALSKSRDKADQYIEKLEGRSSSNSIGNNFKSSLFSFSYEDYLRLFLIIRNKDTKLNRIEDLIQLNMREEIKHRDKVASSDFKLSDCNTYLRVEAKVSTKYIFMTQPFVPGKYRTDDGKRYQYDILAYHGY